MISDHNEQWALQLSNIFTIYDIIPYKVFKSLNLAHEKFADNEPVIIQYIP